MQAARRVGGAAVAPALGGDAVRALHAPLEQ